MAGPKIRERMEVQPAQSLEQARRPKAGDKRRVGRPPKPATEEPLMMGHYNLPVRLHRDIRRIADIQTEGNASALVRRALEEYVARHG